MNLAIILVLIGNFTITSYRSVKNQTDNTPFHTSTGERVSPDGIAVSQNLLCPICLKLHKKCTQQRTDKKLHYNDWIFIEGIGFKRVNDVMNKRFTDRMDVWVETAKEEKDFFNLHKFNRHKVYKA